MEKAYLVLENGDIFEGYAFGAKAKGVGELVFTTGVCGYMETLTDKSYYGQIIMQTFPMIGNYGIIEADEDGKCVASGYVVREWCENPSNFRCEGDIDAYLKKQGIPGIYGVDTRRITAIIREQGVMNAAICSSIPESKEFIKNYKISKAVEAVTGADITKYFVDNAKYSLALVDYGVKPSIVKALNERGCSVTVYPANAQLISILPQLYDGIVLSNGPGAPEEGVYTEQIKELFGKKPVLAIGLGYQLLAIANGAEVEKLRYGHRGANQPCKMTGKNRTYITVQNHGYAVVSDSVKKGNISFVNANDGTCEGIEYKDEKAISVQFYPDSINGTSFIYDEFINMLGGAR